MNPLRSPYCLSILCTVVLASGSLVASNAMASDVAVTNDRSASHAHTAPSFATIPQPLWLKVAVTLGGLAAIAAEWWWFVGQPSRDARQ